MQVVVQIDGYDIAEQILEGVIYNVTLEVETGFDPASRFAFEVVSACEAKPNSVYMNGFTAAQREAWVDQVREWAADYLASVLEDFVVPDTWAMG